MYAMTSLWFESLLLPEGWARQVRVTAADGRIERVDTGAAPAAGEERHQMAVPGMPNVHSHGFQRGLAGLTERRGPGADSFWSWRELMYRFVERLDSTMRAKLSRSLQKRRWRGLGSVPPKPACAYRAGNSVRPMPLRAAAATTRPASSPGSANATPLGSWCR